MMLVKQFKIFARVFLFFGLGFVSILMFGDNSIQQTIEYLMFYPMSFPFWFFLASILPTWGNMPNFKGLFFLLLKLPILPFLWLFKGIKAYRQAAKAKSASKRREKHALQLQKQQNKHEQKMLAMQLKAERQKIKSERRHGQVGISANIIYGVKEVVKAPFSLAGYLYRKLTRVKIQSATIRDEKPQVEVFFVRRFVRRLFVYLPESNAQKEDLHRQVSVSEERKKLK